MQNNIIVHGVSIGEINAALPVVEELQNKTSFAPIVTATTHTGYHNAIKKCAGFPVLYFPLDLYFSVKSFLNFTKPRAIIILETEIWPNLFFAAKKRNIPIFIINARVSEKSWKGYLSFRFFFKKVFQCVNHFSVQTEKDKERLITLAIPEQKISITGNLKFNSAIQKKNDNKRDHFYSLLQLSSSNRVFTAGSTHPGEEKVILDIFKNLLQKISGLKLILSPRHIERIGEIENLLSKLNLQYILLSKIEKRSQIPDIVLVDTIGDLFYLYGISDVVFIGKSLFSPGGGQNMIEPAVWGTPVIFGQFVSHFQVIADSMCLQKAAIMIKDKNEFEDQLCTLLLSSQTKNAFSVNARIFIDKNKDALQRSMEFFFNAVKTS